MNNDPNLNQIELEQKTRALDHLAETTVKGTKKINKVMKPPDNKQTNETVVINTYSTEFLNVLNDLRSIHRQPTVSRNKIRDKFLTLAEISPNDQIIKDTRETANDIITGKIQLKIEFGLSIMEAINAI